jgi:Aromatic-ring-opening dioxygenase LigAB, LigA subunit
MSLHYTFPPASGYPLNRCLYLLKSDDAFRERYLTDPEGTLREAGLDPQRVAALRALDRDKLLALGAHAYLVFMASLRLKMATAPQTFERF